MRKLLCLMLSVLIAKFTLAQDSLSTKPKNNAIEFSAGLRSNHLSKGEIITDQPIFATQVSFALNKARTIRLGAWGGSALSNNADGTQYKEIDYFLSYQKNGFNITLWDYFNSTRFNSAIASDNIFNYSRSRTSHLLNLAIAYQLQHDYPLKIETNVIVYGGANAGEILYQSDGEYDKNRYSSYVEFSYPKALNDEYTVNPFVGVGFAFNPGNPAEDQTTYLYGNGKNKFDVVSLGFTLTKEVSVFNKFNFPLSITTLWNPSRQFARIQLALNIL